MGACSFTAQVAAADDHAALELRNARRRALPRLRPPAVRRVIVAVRRLVMRGRRREAFEARPYPVGREFGVFDGFELARMRMRTSR